MKNSLFINVSIALVCFCNFGSLKAQNPTWSLTPYSINLSTFTPPSPLPTTNDYTGQPAKYNSNMQLDAQGNILFFVVDYQVFNKSGEEIGALYSSTSSLFMQGNAEILIVPDPGNCQRYYIIASADDNSPALNNEIPHYALVDMSQTNESGYQGKLLDVNNDGNTIYSLAAIAPDYFTGDPYQDKKMGGVSLATSKLRGDNSRLLFLTNGKKVYRYKIDNSGISYLGSFLISSISNAFDNLQIRSEMELVSLSNGNYRIAVPYLFAPSLNNSNVSIFTADLDVNGNVISGTSNQLDFAFSTSDTYHPYVHGLEFSNDGNILYITHDNSVLHPNPIEYYAFSNPSAGVQALNVTNAMDFKSSQIEMGIDGKLYFATSNRLATLSNPNTPSTSNWNNNALSISYTPSYAGGATYEYYKKSYTLPDQIDGMDYSQFAPLTYDIETPYTANDNLTTWTQNNNPWNINSNDIYFEDNLIIPAGKTLSIQNMTFHFAPDAKVIIEQGAKLTLNGSTFTNAKLCGDQQDFWKGVEVWGTSNQNQYPANHPTYQGMLVMTNGATIENAHIAASNWKPEDFNHIGGVIQAYNSAFKNNRRDVVFMTYQNHTPTNMLTGDLSAFTNTDFVSDDNFLEKGLAIQVHASMWQVNNIPFTNCHFANNVTIHKDNSTSPDVGIKAINASFSVNTGCSIVPGIGQACPTANLLKSSFTGLKIGVDASSASTSQTVTVQQSNFLNDYAGVRINEINGASVNRNYMELGSAGYSDVTSPGFGIVVANSTGYLVEENTITTNLSPNNFNGIYIYNSGPDDNRVYKNTVSNMVGGVLGIGVNHNSNYQQGLQFLCNTLQKNNSGIFLGATPVTHGIRFYQGNNATSSSPKLSAQNTFANNTVDITNYANSIVYFYNSSTMSQPTFTPPNYVTLDGNAITKSCPSSFRGIIFLPFARSMAIDSLNGKMGTQKVAYDNLDFTYQSLIDNGNTNQFKDSIEYDWSDDAWELRANLLDASPYVSSSSLLQVAEQNILPNGMLLEVLLANPDATRGEDFINKLKITAPTFPDYMLDFVRDNRDAKTLRTNMEGQLAILHTDFTQTRDLLQYLRKNQDEFTNADRLNTIQMGDEIYNKTELMDFYIENNEFAQADSVLVEVKNAKKYSNDLSLIDNYDDYLTFRAGLGTRTIAQLDSSEINHLELLAAGKGRVAGYAQNILCYFYDICYNIDIPKSGTKSMATPTSNNGTTVNDALYNISIYPNPANEYANLQFEIYDRLQNAEYQVYDINGKQMLKGVLNANKGEQVLDTRVLKDGIYIVGIFNNGNLKMSKKMIVKHGK